MTADGVVPLNWPFFEPLPNPAEVLARCPLHRPELGAEELAAYAADFAHRRVTRCERCGRTDGLGESKQHAQFTTTSCDCNFVHIRDTRKVPWA